MADGLKTASKVGQRLKDAARGNRTVAVADVAIGLMAGIAATVSAASGNLIMATATGAAAYTSFDMAGDRLRKAKSQTAKSRAMDALIAGQTQMGALYGRKAVGPSAAGSLDLMRDAAGRAASEMGTTTTIGSGKSGGSGSSVPGPDGQTEGYTRQQNGRNVFVKGYATPSK